jgi:hypothetical protein
MLLFLSLKARPIDMRLTYDDFQKQSDYILLLSVSNIVELTDIPEEFIRLYNGGEYSIFTANCYVRSCFKGDLNTNMISITFAQDPGGRPGFNGIVPVPFYEELCLPEKRRTAYLAYLKKDSNGNYVPLTGHQDAGFSIKIVYDRFGQQCKLPQDFSVLQPRDIDDNPILRKGESSWIPPGALPQKADKK